MCKVLVPLANGCEELEAVTIIDLLRRAEIDVVTAALDDITVVASRGVKLIADCLLDDIINDQFDMIVLPGGLPGADYLNNDERIQTLLARVNEQNGYLAAICAAPKVLANAGLLSGKDATSFPGVLESMQLPDTRLLGDAVVQDARVITSKGPGTAMDFALHLIEILVGTDKKQMVEKGLQRP